MPFAIAAIIYQDFRWNAEPPFYESNSQWSNEAPNIDFCRTRASAACVSEAPLSPLTPVPARGTLYSVEVT
ncbi:MAG: hypothetical protein WA824_03460, partial [Candidatus Sulfotelmatobacter sp.]